jgi:hypothetical protein
MSAELLDLDDLATMYKCSRRHARDVITKMIGFPDLAPGSTLRNPRWLRGEVRAFLHRKSNYSRRNPAQVEIRL